MLRTNWYENWMTTLGTTRGKKFSVLHTFFFLCLVNRGFWPLTQSQEYPGSSQCFPCGRTVGVSSSICTFTKRSRSWTKPWASSFVCTSPLAVTFWALIPFAQHEHWSSRIDHEFSFLWSFWNRRRRCLNFNRREKPSFTCKSAYLSHSAKESLMSRSSGFSVSQKKVEVRIEKEWDVQVTSNTETTTTAHGTWRARCEDDFWRDTMLILRQARKVHVCGMCKCTRM